MAKQKQTEAQTDANPVETAAIVDQIVESMTAEPTDTPASPEIVSAYFGIPQFSMPKDGHRRFPGTRRENGREVLDPAKDTVTVFSAIVPCLAGPIDAIPVTAYGTIDDAGQLGWRATMPGTSSFGRAKQTAFVSDAVKEHFRQWVSYHAAEWSGLDAMIDGAINVLIATEPEKLAKAGDASISAAASSRLVRKLTPEQIAKRNERLAAVAVAGK